MLKPELSDLLVSYGLDPLEIEKLTSQLENFAASSEALVSGFQAQIDNATRQRDEATEQATFARALVQKLTA